MKVLAQMIVRNEAGRYLRKTVPAILDVADWLLVHDDGSTDGTRDLLEEFDRVIVRGAGSSYSLWDEEGEGVAREHLLAETLKWDPTPDWVISIDADELIAEPKRLRGVLGLLKGAEVASMTMKEVWSRLGVGRMGPTSVWYPENAAVPPPPKTFLRDTFRDVWLIRTDGGWAPRECPVIWRPPREAFRLTREAKWGRGWTIPPRRLACGREPEVVRLLDAVPTGVDLLHLGWSDPSEREARYERYVRLDGGRYHADAHIRSIVEEPDLLPYEVPGVW